MRASVHPLLHREAQREPAEEQRNAEKMSTITIFLVVFALLGVGLVVCVALLLVLTVHNAWWIAMHRRALKRKRR